MQAVHRKNKPTTPHSYNHLTGDKLYYEGNVTFGEKPKYHDQR